MSIEPHKAMFANGSVQVITDVCEGLLGVRNAVEMLVWSDEEPEGRALLQQLDAAAGEHIMLVKMLHTISDQLRAGINPRQVAHQIEGKLRSLAPVAADPDDELSNCAGEGEV